MWEKPATGAENPWFRALGNLLTLSRTAKSGADIFMGGQLMLRIRNGDSE